MKLEQRLLKKHLLSKEALDRALDLSRETLKPLPAVLIENGFLSEPALLETQAEQYGFRFVNLEDVTVDRTAVNRVPAKLASHYAVVPLKLEGDVLTLAVSSPMDLSAAEDIETNLGFRVERVLACRADIAKALARYYGVGADTVERILSESADRPEISAGEEAHDLRRLAGDASVVRLVNQIIQEAIDDRATDIHFEAQRNGVCVRRRIDGILYDTQVPENMRLLYPAIVSRVKLMSGLNIVERRLPQDGRTRVKVGQKPYDLRISVVPAIHGEDIVARILPATMLLGLEQLGFSERHMAMLKDLIAKPHGIIFVTGPTGSGKSTTLYACLSQLNSRARKIITIEDPVEYELAGITQTQIHPAIELTFSRALRGMLRHDPDVMMIGEVRDRETAEIAIQTAMTGHLVFSTLHTNDAAGAAVRLVDMGIDPYLIASTVLVFVAQRLVRVICAECRTRIEADGRTLYKGAGCRSCGGSGFRGRVAISEFLPLYPDIQRVILAKASAQAIREKADAVGLATLLQDGHEKVEQGITTIDEVLRVTSL
ncbi:MAG: GspE/PulE family protein [Verrucomicrobiota bacterium]|nr:GspE/PulE family protein [Verrucomicrobiota bacterium]